MSMNTLTTDPKKQVRSSQWGGGICLVVAVGFVVAALLDKRQQYFMLIMAAVYLGLALLYVGRARWLQNKNKL